jgi:hypothetical protein
VLTCTLLGTLLGWLRLGLRGTTYGPLGWIPLLAVVALVLGGRWRAAVVVPERGSDATAGSEVTLLRLAARPGADDSRLPN